MGTPEFALVSLKALFDADYPIVGVFAQPDKPYGRGRKMQSPASALFAKEKGIPLFQPASVKTEEVIQEIEKLKPDFIVVAAYGKILPQRILDAATIDCLNVHASLLPKYRGAAPIQRALMNGDGETGVSIMKMVAKMDAGPVYSMKTLSIEPQDNTGTLTQKLAQLGASLLLESLAKIKAQELTSKEQDEAQVTFSPSLKKEEGKICWDQPARDLFNFIRGLNPWPSAYTFIDNKRLKIYDSVVLPEKLSETPGKIYLISPKGLHVACRDSSLCITRVQLEGKKEMPASDFARGYRLEEGKVL